MLIRGDTCYVPTAVSMIVLQGENGMYYYLHRPLYDQRVILHDQYIGLIPFFYKLLGLGGEHPKICDAFMESVPEPLGTLTPFLGIITGCEKLDDIDGVHGVISSMSMSVDFWKMFKVPTTARTSIKFSLSVREEYHVQWGRFFAKTPTFEQVYSDKAYTARSAPIDPTEDSVGITEEGGEAIEVNYTDSAYDMDGLVRVLDTASEAIEEEDESGGSSITEEAVEKRPKVRSDFTILKGLK